MRKILFLLALCFATAANAQSFRLGPLASMELNSPSDMKSKVGFNMGIHGEMAFDEATKGLFVDASLLFDAKNFKSDVYYNEATKVRSEWTYNTLGLTLPVNIGYKFAVAPSISLFAAAGPYINVGLGGKSKVQTMQLADGSSTKSAAGETTKYESGTVSDNVYSDKLMNRISWGIGFKIGAEFGSHYQVGVGYELGLNKIFKDALDCKHRTLALGVAYMF